MRCTYRSVGFLVSALVHLVAAAVVLPRLPGQPSPGQGESPVPVSLSMFRSEAAPVQPLVEKGDRPRPEPSAGSRPPPAPERHSEPSAPAPASPARPVTDQASPSTPVRRPRDPERPATGAPRRDPRSDARRARPHESPEKAEAATSGVRGQAVSSSQAESVEADGPASAPSGKRPASARDEYLRALVRRIHREKYYPHRARRRRQEGEVVVAFVIDPSGRFSDLRVTRSSGHRELDLAALETLQRVSPFREPPTGTGGGRWELAVPIAYRLRR